MLTQTEIGAADEPMNAHANDVPRCLIEAFPPDAFALFLGIRPYVDGLIIDDIANADCGYGVEENLKALQRRLDLQDLMIPIQWEPHEVLSLVRWERPAQNDDLRFYFRRAFCCTCLLLAATHPESWNLISSEVDTLIQLLDCVLALGETFTNAFGQFITWRMNQIPADGENERVFFALILFFIAVTTRRITEGELRTITDWLIRTEDHERTAMGEFIPYPSQWLLGLTHFNQEIDTWRRHANRLISSSQWIRDDAVREGVLDVVRRLTAVP